MLLPAELENLVVEDRQPFAEEAPAEIGEHRDLAGLGIDGRQPRRIADQAGAFEQLVAADFEALGETQDVAPHLRLRPRNVIVLGAAQVWADADTGHQRGNEAGSDDTRQGRAHRGETSRSLHESKALAF